jgi:hypothetical protein
MYRVSSLGRPIDPHYKSNLHAVLGSGLAALLVVAYNAIAVVSLGASPFAAAIAVFIAWAIGRELDPDRNAVAVLAMAISFLAVLIGPPELMLGAGVLAATRIISGTVGAPLRSLDLLALVGLAALLGAGGITVVAVPGLLLASVVGLAGRRQAVIFSAALVVAAAASAFTIRPSLAWEAGPGAALIMLALSLVAVGIRPPLGPVATSADLGGSLSPRRIEAARLVAAGTVAVGFLLGGGTGVVAAFPTAGAAAVAAWVVGFTNLSSAQSRAGAKESA